MKYVALYESQFEGMQITQEKSLYRRTASGRSWSSKPERTITEEITPRQYMNSVCCGWPGDRTERGCTYAGYLPVKITSTSPDGGSKWVFRYSFRLMK